LKAEAQEVILAQPIHGLLRSGRQFLPWGIKSLRPISGFISPFAVSFSIRARRNRDLKKTLFAGD
jgi:hypothetical protein